jgi:hypothetical protein
MRGDLKVFFFFILPHPSPLQQERETALLNLMAVTLERGNDEIHNT